MHGGAASALADDAAGGGADTLAAEGAAGGVAESDATADGAAGGAGATGGATGAGEHAHARPNDRSKNDQSGPGDTGNSISRGEERPSDALP